MVNKEKAYQHVNERKRKRGENVDGDNAGDKGGQSTTSVAASGEKKLRRQFKQVQPIGKGGELDRSRVSKKLVQSVFSSHQEA
jgi:hypothetical protein